MPDCKYIEENGSATILVTKRSAGVALEVNFRECVTYMPLLSVNKAADSGFETLRRHHQKFKTGEHNYAQWQFSGCEFSNERQTWGL